MTNRVRRNEQLKMTRGSATSWVVTATAKKVYEAIRSSGMITGAGGIEGLR